MDVLSTNLRVDVESLFHDFETVVSENAVDASQQDKRKASLQAIIDLIKKNIAPDPKNI
ncbi:MAG: hypothetical protein WCJ39_06545 [bacterium]